MAKVAIDLEQIKQKLYQKLVPSGWGDKLKSFILSEEFDKILLKLYEESQSGMKFTPVLKQVFRAFEECPWKNLKVVTLGQDPYPYPGVCDGLAFSCGNTGKIQASLRYIHREIKETVYPNEDYDYPADLTPWANQGVLLLNTAFTTTINKVGTHYLIWRPFLVFVLDMISAYNPGMIYVFFGKIAQQYASGMPDNNYKLLISHPASAAHNNAERWNSEDVFNKINGILIKNNNLKITW